MTRDRDHYYAFDPHLDDSQQWRAGEYACPDCGFEFVFTCRVDRDPECPRCVESRRWERRAAYTN